MTTSTSMITVTPDTTDPIFLNCPADLTVNVDAGQCDANVVYSTPIADDCNGATVAFTSGIMSGQTFPLGDTPIVFTATDACNNTTTCEFTITVIDSDEPTLICPTNEVVVCNDDASCAWESDTSIVPVGLDDCPSASIAYNVTGATTIANSPGPIAEGTTFELGTSTVTYTITDGAGNTSTCSFNVVVEDCTVPIIDCVSNLTLECGNAGNAASIATWINMNTATDNCPDEATPVTVTHSIISTLEQCGGTSTTIYEFTATDLAGNTSTCRANVIIEDTTDPSIAVFTTDVTVECDGNGNVDGLLGWLADNGNIPR